MAKHITWDNIQRDIGGISAEVSKYCKTDTTGLEDWLSNAATDTRATARQLAREWYGLSNGR